MVKILYIPDRGDILWMSFDPVSGHEQGGRRPAYVFTEKEYNSKTGLMIVCPITKKQKGYTCEIPFQGEKVSGFLLVDQVQARDWKHREIDFIERADPKFHEKAFHRLSLILS